jgi:hypothetical protein
MPCAKAINVPAGKPLIVRRRCPVGRTLATALAGGAIRRCVKIA